MLVPALIGGQWATDLDMSAPGSPYLDTLVAMHVATAAALVIFFRRDWARLTGALLTSIRHREIGTANQRLVWLLVAATVPVGLAGLVLDKITREYLGKPIRAALFLTANGLILAFVEYLQRKRYTATEPRRPAGPASSNDATEHHGLADPNAETVLMPIVDATHPSGQSIDDDSSSDDTRLARLGWGEAIATGGCQILVLLPGISRSGVTIAGGLLRRLDHEDAARRGYPCARLAAGAAHQPGVDISGRQLLKNVPSATEWSSGSATRGGVMVRCATDCARLRNRSASRR